MQFSMHMLNVLRLMSNEKAEILGEVIWNEKVLELHKELFWERR